jgi:hypothetical protein
MERNMKRSAVVVQADQHVDYRSGLSFDGTT